MHTRPAHRTGGASSYRGTAGADTGGLLGVPVSIVSGGGDSTAILVMRHGRARRRLRLCDQPGRLNHGWLARGAGAVRNGRHRLARLDEHWAARRFEHRAVETRVTQLGRTAPIAAAVTQPAKQTRVPRTSAAARQHEDGGGDANSDTSMDHERLPSEDCPNESGYRHNSAGEWPVLKHSPGT